MGHGPVCYTPKFMEIESLVPRDKVFKAFQNIWAWKPSGHVTNILISSYLKVYMQNFVKKGQVVSSLSSEVWPLRQKCQSMGIIYTHYDVLDVDATYKVSCKSVQWFWRIFWKVHNIYGHGGHLGHVPNIVRFNFIFRVWKSLHTKFGWKWSTAFWENPILIFMCK